MEASSSFDMVALAERAAATEQNSRPTEAVASAADGHKMFRFSEFLHIGEGAEECEKAGRDRCESLGEDGKVVNTAERCDDPGHFHAFCRVPNKFQHKDIREKAMAAKSRRTRAMRDQESDAHAVLEAELDELRQITHEDLIIDELVAKDYSTDYVNAAKDVEERDEFEHIQQDRERYEELVNEQKGKSEDDWPDELTELHKHLGSYVDAISDQLTTIQKPKREALASKGIDGLVELLRDQRIELAGDQEFGHVYATWTWFIGTLRVEPDPVLKRPYQRYFDSVAQMVEAPSEVVDALKDSFDALELAMQRGARGNS